MSENTPPVKGYQPLSPEFVRLANHIKEVEEALLRLVDLAQGTDLDQRWVAIARTHFQEGFMAFGRANFQPQRINGPIDPELAFEEAGKLLEARKPKRPSIGDALRDAPLEIEVPRDLIVGGTISAAKVKDLDVLGGVFGGGFVSTGRSNELIHDESGMGSGVSVGKLKAEEFVK